MATTKPLQTKNKSTSTIAIAAKTYKDLDVLPIRVTPNPPRSSSIAETYHYLYLRPHNPAYTAQINAPKSINDRSLLALNVPIDSTTTHFRALFSALGGGRVDTVIFEDEPLPPLVESSEYDSSKSKKRKRVAEEEKVSKVLDERKPFPSVWDRKIHRSGCSAVIVFVDKASCEMSLKAVKRQIEGTKKKDVVWGEGMGKGNTLPPLGIERYKAHQKLIYPDPAVLQQIVDESLSAYDERIELETLARRKTANEPDEDGFVTVIRNTRPKPTPTMEELEERKRIAKEASEKGTYKDFYRFQQREVKKEEMQNLLNKFEEDKRKVQQLGR